MSIGRIGRTVNLPYTAVRDRLMEIRRRFPHPEADDHRIDTGHQVDELAHQQYLLAQTALKMGDINQARACLKEVASMLRLRIDLFGLKADGSTPPDVDRIGQLLDQLADMPDPTPDQLRETP